MKDEFTTADLIKICKAYQQLGTALQAKLDHLINYPEQIADLDEGGIEAVYNFLLNAPSDLSGFLAIDSESILDRMDLVIHPDQNPEDLDLDEEDEWPYHQLADDR